LPEAGVFSYLIEIIGNLSAFSWSELESYCRLTGTILSPLESEIVVNCGVLYESELTKQEKTTPAPFEILERDKVSDTLNRLFKSLK
jgi:hypothetical protein